MLVSGTGKQFEVRATLIQKNVMGFIQIVDFLLCNSDFATRHDANGKK